MPHPINFTLTIPACHKTFPFVTYLWFTKLKLLNLHHNFQFPIKTFYMENSLLTKRFLIISPLFVLIFTRIGIEINIRIFDAKISWIPSFIIYYIVIALISWLAIRFFKIKLRETISFTFKPVPKTGLLIGTIIVPALLPVSAFITQAHFVPNEYYLYILIFAFINAFFEEGYWRGLLALLPGNNAFRIIYSAALFSFSHLFFWGYWFKTPIIIIPTAIATFIMGLLWMHFMNKKKNLLYVYLSHVLVDIFNNSVAVYAGLVTPDAF